MTETDDGVDIALINVHSCGSESSFGCAHGGHGIVGELDKVFWVLVVPPCIVFVDGTTVLVGLSRFHFVLLFDDEQFLFMYGNTRHVDIEIWTVLDTDHNTLSCCRFTECMDLAYGIIIF